MRLSLPPQRNDHSLGPEWATATLIAYSDFQCPHSKKVNHWIHELLKLDHDVRFIHRHFPLSDIHTYSVYAALAAEAASLQGEFWNFQKGLFNIKEQLTPMVILSLANELKLNVNELISTIDKKTTIEKIYRDISSGRESGVQSPPVLFLNGIRLEGPLKEEVLHESIQCVRKGKILPA